MALTCVRRSAPRPRLLRSDTTTPAPRPLAIGTAPTHNDSLVPWRDTSSRRQRPRRCSRETGSTTTTVSRRDHRADADDAVVQVVGGTSITCPRRSGSSSPAQELRWCCPSHLCLDLAEKPTQEGWGRHHGGMAAVPSSANVSARMSKQARRDTSPEVAVRKLLHARGRRYRLHVSVPGMSRRTMDIAFPGPRVAVFIDGCFWHSCPQHATHPKANSSWWQQKLTRNALRDQETTRHLESQGWQVLRFWEHEAPEWVADQISRAVETRSRKTRPAHSATPAPSSGLPTSPGRSI